MDYYIQLSFFGYAVCNKDGKVIMEIETEEQAKEYIEKLENNNGKQSRTIEQTFIDYCKNLPGKCYYGYDNIVTTTNEKALKNYISSFEKKFNVEVIYEMVPLEDEYFYPVVEIIQRK